MKKEKPHWWRFAQLMAKIVRREVREEQEAALRKAR